MPHIYNVTKTKLGNCKIVTFVLIIYINKQYLAIKRVIAQITFNNNLYCASPITDAELELDPIGDAYVMYTTLL